MNIPLYRTSQKRISLTVAYLIGTKRNLLEDNNPNELDTIKKLDENKNAVIIRALCNIRSNMLLNYTQTERSIMFDMQNIDKQPMYKDDVKTLYDYGLSIVKANCRTNKYIIDINRLITDRINNVKDVFPEWINWEYIRDLFVMPRGQDPNAVKNESNKYCGFRLQYPFTRYINWKPVDDGNILFNDEKFLRILYKQHDDEFTDTSKIKDASESVKTNIYDFINNSGSTVIAVDCENSDAYKLASVLTQLDSEKTSHIKKIMLYDDAHTTKAWSFLDKITGIPVQHIMVDRIKETKSLVDIKMCVGVSEAYYRDNIDSFILCSSDSDFWGLISSLPDAKFLVMIEYTKCGSDIKNALIQNGTYYCSIDDFCTGNIKAFKSAVLHNELQSRMDDIINMNADELMNDVFATLRMDPSDTEKQNFYKKYIQGMQLYVDKDGYLKIKVPTP